MWDNSKGSDVTGPRANPLSMTTFRNREREIRFGGLIRLSVIKYHYRKPINVRLPGYDVALASRKMLIPSRYRWTGKIGGGAEARRVYARSTRPVDLSNRFWRAEKTSYF